MLKTAITMSLSALALLALGVSLAAAKSIAAPAVAKTAPATVVLHASGGK
jgi:hypothetical protein